MAIAARLPARNAAHNARHNAIWRWHFYAGLFCMPFVIGLALTGTIYLWRPQIEAWLDRPFDHRAAAGPLASPDAQVAAATGAVPGSTLHSYILPETPEQAVRILVTRDGVDRRVYVDPRSLAVLKVTEEEKRPLRVVFHLHGELLMGKAGSYLVEIAACWTIVLLLTGLYLWWPRERLGLAGVLYPRLRAGGRTFWRDIHATAGIWGSLFALGLILTGLPWAEGWGNYLAAVRRITATATGPVDWPVGGTVPAADPAIGPHAGHAGMAMPPAPMPPGDLARVIVAARPLGVAPPVLIGPPARAGAPWSVASDAADRPRRSDLTIDGASGRILFRTGFDRKHWIDRTIGYGIAAHEGALFGLANQVLGTVTALFLMALSVSGAVMWWRRRPARRLGAPRPIGHARFGPAMVAAIVLLALCLPMFGLTLAAVLVVERVVLGRIPSTRRWLGLRARPRAT